MFGKGGVLSSFRRAPKYVLGAYWRGNLVRRRRKVTKNARARIRVGARVDRSCDADEDVPREAATFVPSLALVLVWKSGQYYLPLTSD